MAAAFRPERRAARHRHAQAQRLRRRRRLREQPWGRDIMLVAVTGWGQDEDRRRSPRPASTCTSSSRSIRRSSSSCCRHEARPLHVDRTAELPGDACGGVAGAQPRRRREEDRAAARAAVRDRRPAVRARRWACCSGRRSSTATRSRCCSTATQIFPAMLDGDPQRAGARSPSRPTSTGRATIGQRVRRRAGRARARRRQGARAARLGRQREDGRAHARRDEGAPASRSSAIHPPHWYHLGAHEQPHPPQAAGRRRRGRLHRRRRHRRRVARQRAGPGALARHALPRRGPGGGADAGGVHGQLDQGHRPRAARRRLLPGAAAARRPARADVQQLAHRRQREHAADVPAGDHRRAQHASTCRAPTSCPTSSRCSALVDGRASAASRCSIIVPGAHIDTEVVRTRVARALGRRCSRPASRSTSTSRRCSTARC